MASNDTSISLLRESLRYDRATGELFWLVRPLSHFKSERDAARWNSRHAGKPAFVTVVRGYASGDFFGKTHRAHRVAWALSHGEWPIGQIDHIDGNRANNALENLRVVSCAENNRNRKRPNNNTSGSVGVTWNARDKRWRAQICVNGSSRQIGAYLSKEDAISARASAAKACGFHENHGRGV